MSRVVELVVFFLDVCEGSQSPRNYLVKLDAFEDVLLLSLTEFVTFSN